MKNQVFEMVVNAVMQETTGYGVHKTKKKVEEKRVNSEHRNIH